MCYYTLVFLCGTSCGSWFYIVFLAYDNGMGLRYGSWNRAPNDAITQTSISILRRGWEFQINCRAKGPRT